MIPVYQGEAARQKLESLKQITAQGNESIVQSVREIIGQVRADGDSALRALAERFGDPVLDSPRLSEDAIAEAVARVPEETQQLLRAAAENIRAYAEAVMRSAQPVVLDRGGFSVGMDWRPVERVACYVPGGRFPLPSTALMTAITAQAAGVPEICIVSPAFCDEVVFAGTLAGVRTFYRMGGAQAVAAVAFGTQTVTPVDMLVGPGNAYVTEAKRQLQGVIGIDMLAGPSEVAIIADSGADPNWVALDLLAQAEHDPDARAYLLTDSAELAARVVEALTERAASEALPGYLKQPGEWGAILVLPDLAACVEAANLLAPEHLELLVSDPRALKPSLRHYGGLFMGYGAPVPVGDYMAGPNHTLPTGRTARFSGGLNPLTFLRPQSWIHVQPTADLLWRQTAQLADLEGLTAHALSARARVE